MSDIVIYHNGTCSKCRGALEILQERGVPHAVRWYLAEPLNEDELARLLKLLGIHASELVRKDELYYKEHLEDKDFDEEEWIEILVTHPELIQRPIVVHGDRALVARPPERVLEIL